MADVNVTVYEPACANAALREGGGTCSSVDEAVNAAEVESPRASPANKWREILF